MPYKAVFYRPVTTYKQEYLKIKTSYHKYI